MEVIPAQSALNSLKSCPGSSRADESSSKAEGKQTRIDNITAEKYYQCGLK